MKNLIEFPLEAGGNIIVEIEDVNANGIQRASRGSDALIKAQLTLEQALEKVKPAASGIIKKIRSLNDQPDEVQVEFGLKMNCEAGAIIASGGAEANYKVTLKWKKPEPK